MFVLLLHWHNGIPCGSSNFHIKEQLYSASSHSVKRTGTGVEQRHNSHQLTQPRTRSVTDCNGGDFHRSTFISAGQTCLGAVL